MLTISYHQTNTNIHNRLKTVKFDDKQSCDTHVSEFISTIGELASYD